MTSYAEEWRHFAEAVRGRAEVCATLEDGRRALEMALAAAESSRTGRAVKIDDLSLKFKAEGPKSEPLRSESA